MEVFEENPLPVVPPMMTPVPLVLEFPLSVVKVEGVEVTFSDDEPPVVFPVTTLPPLSVVTPGGIVVAFSRPGVVSVSLVVVFPLTTEPPESVVLLCDSVVTIMDSVVICDCAVVD